MTWRVRMSAKLNSATGKYGYTAWIKDGDNPPRELAEPSTWANYVQGAILEGLTTIFHNHIPPGRHVIIENPYNNDVLRHIVMECQQENKDKYRELSRLLNERACRLSSPGREEVRAGGLPWHDAPADWAGKEQALLRRIEEMETERDQLQARLLEEQQAFETLQREREAFGQAQKRVSRAELPDLFSTWVAEARNILAKRWGRCRRQVDAAQQGALLQPMVISRLIREYDPTGDRSFAWPAFLLGRAYEVLWNRRVLDPLAGFLSGCEAVRKVARLNPKAGTIRLNLVGKHDFSIVRERVILSFRQENRCSLRDVQLVLWDGVAKGAEARPIEWQEAVSKWVDAAKGRWIWESGLRDEIEWVRHDIRNPTAHGHVFVPDSEYARLEGALLTGKKATILRLASLGQVKSASGTPGG